jgi:hypothetical protein
MKFGLAPTTDMIFMALIPSKIFLTQSYREVEGFKPWRMGRRWRRERRERR